MLRRPFSSAAIACAGKRPPKPKPFMPPMTDLSSAMRQEQTEQQLRQQEQSRLTQERRSREGYSKEDLQYFEPRIDVAGEIYSPQDLAFEARRPLNRRRAEGYNQDDFAILGIDPQDEYKSFNLLSEYISTLGRIKPREATGLSAKNQRKLGKAVRRARALGILSTTAQDPSLGQAIKASRQRPVDWLQRD
ncbi:ribosomal protein S18 [Protomyces lactucae-debilis]|uniref:Small ribosomal subunit protein bS18m n=1 Tax=Protomyces lactucae-debilis TaxID=2754530 RepID=A0A1Y2FK31_PROLT|nr:ribosomal protein S18 [Protomyces lactucae-debilis]ORY84331.1 ribosomal protein S18 [Protomyces lactucae-debilis]